jgi:hypothetical protein
MILIHQLLPDLVDVCGRLPIHVENLIAGPNVGSRVAVTVHAPTHVKARCLRDYGHLVNLSVTRCAGHALVNVGTVIEIGVIGQSIDSIPDKRFLAISAITHRGQFVTVAEHFTVTVHADL